ncbi:MAG: methylmalonyl-CoA epimerase [Rhodobacteraceae bacterium]|nr:methylmalonyl-CoA epimerase [Paracoccaceae bacterium]
MIGHLNHIAIVVPDLDAAITLYRTAMGASVSEPLPMPEHGVTVAFVSLPNTKIELMEPLGNDSPVAGYLARNPAGGIHHICLEVPDMDQATEAVTAAGIRTLGEPRTGAHEKPVVFLHPKDCVGTLIEFEEI